MRSPCAGAALDPPLWIVPNYKALSLSLSLSLSRVYTILSGYVATFGEAGVPTPGWKEGRLIATGVKYSLLRACSS
jgi:hypothetical protein